MDDRMAQRPGVSPGDLFWLFLFLNFLLVIFVRDIIIDQIVYWEWTDADGAASIGRLLAPLAALAALVSLCLAHRVLPWMVGRASPGLGWKVSAAMEAAGRGARLLLRGTGRTLSALGRGVKSAASLARRSVVWAGRRSGRGAVLLWDATVPLWRVTGAGLLRLGGAVGRGLRAAGGLALVLLNGVGKAGSVVGTALWQALTMAAGAALGALRRSGRSIRDGARSMWRISRPLRHTVGGALLALGAVLKRFLMALRQTLLLALDVLWAAASKMAIAFRTHLGSVLANLEAVIGRTIGTARQVVGRLGAPLRRIVIATATGVGAFLGGTLGAVKRRALRAADALGAAAAASLRTAGNVLGSAGAAIGQVLSAVARHAQKAWEGLQGPVRSALETTIVVTGLAVAGVLALLAALAGLAAGSVRRGWARTRKLTAWAWNWTSAATRLVGRALGKAAYSSAGILGKGAAAVGWTALSAAIAMVGFLFAASRPLAEALAALRRAIATGLGAAWRAVSLGATRLFSALWSALDRVARRLGKMARSSYARGKPLVVACARGFWAAVVLVWRGATLPIVMGYRLIKGAASGTWRVVGRAARVAREPVGRAAAGAWDAVEHGGRAIRAVLSLLLGGFLGGAQLVGAGLRNLGTVVAPPVRQLLASASRGAARVGAGLSKGARAGGALAWKALWKALTILAFPFVLLLGLLGMMLALAWNGVQATTGVASGAASAGARVARKKGARWVAQSTGAALALLGLATVGGASMALVVFGPRLMAIVAAPPCGPIPIPGLDVSDETIRISMASSLTKKEWLDDAVKEFNATSRTSPELQVGGRPIFVQVIRELTGPGQCQHYRSGTQVADTIEGKIRPTVLSPAETSWIHKLEEDWGRRHGGQKVSTEPARDILRTPLIIAMWQSRAQALECWPTPGSRCTWARVRDLAANPGGWAALGHPEWGSFKLGYGYVGESDAGTWTTILLCKAGTGKPGALTQDDLVAPGCGEAIAAAERVKVHSGTSSTWLLSQLGTGGPEYLDAVTTYEKEVISFNIANRDKLREPLVSVYPQDGTVVVTHPFIILDGAEWVTPEQVQAAKLFRAFLLSEGRQALLSETGLRPLNAAARVGSPIERGNGANPEAQLVTVPGPDAQTLEGLVRLWHEKKKQASIVVVFDMSGSMRGEKIGAAVLGAQSFVSGMDGDDWVAWVPFNDRVQAGAAGLRADVQEQLVGQVGSTRASGGTALYDAVKEAYRLLLDRRRAAGDNQRYGMVVLSDGKDTDSSATLEQVQEMLRPAEDDPYGIQIHTIAIGTDADEDILKKIASSGHGRFWKGQTAEDMVDIYNQVGMYY